MWSGILRFWFAFSHGSTSDAEPLFVCLMTICILCGEIISYLSSLPIFKIGGLFLVVEFKSSLCILDTNNLSFIWFANIFSYSIVCLFNFDFILWYRIFSSDVNPFFFYFRCLCFGVIFKRSLIILCHVKLFLCVLFFDFQFFFPFIAVVSVSLYLVSAILWTT